ncbi:hypothetical protein [Thermomonas sp.]
MLIGSLKAKNTDNQIDVLMGPNDTLLIVDHPVEKNSIRQVITWKLASKALRKGDFISFEWTDAAAAAGIFDAPVISADGNSLTIGDHNDLAATKTEHPYRIKVSLNGTVYSSDATRQEGLLKDPIIINK